jgi:hypothetical protein
MLIYSFMWKIEPTKHDAFFTQAWNHRLGTSGLGPAEILQYAAQHNIDPRTIPTMVEVRWRMRCDDVDVVFGGGVCEWLRV